MKSNFYSNFENLDLASGWCFPDVRTFFNTEDSRLCGASRHLQWPVRMVAQEPAVLTWKLHGIFIDIFLETCDHTHGMKWDTVHFTWRLWIEPIILLKRNYYIKCFCQPECYQYKILTNSPFGHSGTKKTLGRFGNTFPVQNTKYSPFLSQKDKG